MTKTEKLALMKDRFYRLSGNAKCTTKLLNSLAREIRKLEKEI